MKGYLRALIVIVAGFAVLAPFASSYPDGLEKVAETLGVVEADPLWEGIMPDYTLPTVENPYFSTLLSGFAGMLLVLALSYALGKAVSKNSLKGQY